MAADDALVAELRVIVAGELPEGLDAAWPVDAPLVDAGLSSVTLLGLVAALEQRYAIALGGDDLVAENFESLERLAALVARRTAGR